MTRPRRAIRRSTLDRLPPALSLLMEELSTSGNAKQRKGRLKDNSFFKDLQEQALWSLIHWNWIDLGKARPAEHKQLVVLSDGVNPLTSSLKCANATCREAQIEDVGRYAALFTDGIVVTDHLTWHMALSDPEIAFRVIVESIPALDSLLPLVDAGLLSFATPTIGVCGECAAHRNSRPKEIAGSLVTVGKKQFSVVGRDTKAGRWIEISNEFLLSNTRESIVLSVSETSGLPKRLRLKYKDGEQLTNARFRDVRPDLEGLLASFVHTLLFQANLAQRMGAPLLTGTRLEALALEGGGKADSRSIEQVSAWEARRAIELPWLCSLSLEQAMRLRREAPESLDRLRTRIAETVQAESGTSKLVADLRAEVSDVERAIRTELKWVDVGLAMAKGALVSYGLANSASLGVASSLLSAAVSLRRDAVADARRVAEAKVRPGYALLRAARLGSRPTS